VQKLRIEWNILNRTILVTPAVMIVREAIARRAAFAFVPLLDVHVDRSVRVFHVQNAKFSEV
jgi:hypothetical protein